MHLHLRALGAADPPALRRSAITSSSDSFHPAVLGTRQRLIAGIIGIGLGIGIPLALSVVLLAQTGDPEFLIFPLPFLGAMWFAQGLAPTGYTLGADALVIERRWMPRVIPYGAIRGVDRRLRPIGGFLSLGFNSLFGSHGTRWNPRTGFHYLAITNTRDLVYLETPRGLVVLSPDQPEEFVAELRRRAAPPPEEVSP